MAPPERPLGPEIARAGRMLRAGMQSKMGPRQPTPAARRSAAC